MSQRFELVKGFYAKGLWTAGMAFNAISKGWITEEEYALITTPVSEEPSEEPLQP